jgi:hypothetical protein
LALKSPNGRPQQASPIADGCETNESQGDRFESLRPLEDLAKSPGNIATWIATIRRGSGGDSRPLGLIIDEGETVFGI